MKGAINREVPSGLCIPTLFGTNSPKITCREVIIKKPTPKATAWMKFSGSTELSKGSIRLAMAGSPKAPRLRDEIVIPNWHTAR